MKIGGAPRAPATKPMRSKTASKPSASGAATAVDETVLMGIPDIELTPRVREALFSLMAEVQNLRAELVQMKGRMGELETLADHDPLLDIYNRRAFVRELDRTLAMVSRYDVQACLVFIDLNDLKIINDERGHLAGDAALKHVATALSTNIRQTDVAGRLGGDEFGLLLTHVDQEKAEKKVTDLAQLVSAIPVKGHGDAFTVKISCGVVSIGKGVTADEAMESADSAMYAAKKKK